MAQQRVNVRPGAGLPPTATNALDTFSEWHADKNTHWTPVEQSEPAPASPWAYSHGPQDATHFESVCKAERHPPPPRLEARHTQPARTRQTGQCKYTPFEITLAKSAR